MTPLQIFLRPFPRLINPANVYEIERLRKITGTFRVAPTDIQYYSGTGWVEKGIVIFGEQEIIDPRKSSLNISLSELGKNMLIELDKGYVWNTFKKSIDLKATRNFYIQYTRPNQYHFHHSQSQEAIILPQWIAKKLHDMNDRRLDDIKDMMQMIMLKADKVRDVWIISSDS